MEPVTVSTFLWSFSENGRGDRITMWQSAESIGQAAKKLLKKMKRTISITYQDGMPIDYHFVSRHLIMSFDPHDFTIQLLVTCNCPTLEEVTSVLAGNPTEVMVAVDMGSGLSGSASRP